MSYPETKIIPRSSNVVILESREQGRFEIMDAEDNIRISLTERSPFKIRITTSDYKKHEFEVISVEMGLDPRFY